ncbi:MAG: hypothetical protein CL746_01230 [Chloroflexi bacterium]|nr:hypothetical protein [Chloroflexota bacterium]|tara:strand:+ start:16999 stop:17301 length:303 start_codon:yes stop_codon:yes gene_type:complete
MSKIAHLRVYPIKKGMESKWIELFSKKLVPEMKKAGIVVETAWMDKENSKFIWVRSYGSTEKDIEVKEKLFYESKWWKENVNFVRGHLGENREITIIYSI